MFLIPMVDQMSFASSMTWIKESRWALKIDWGVFLRMVSVMSVISVPLMLIARLAAGISLPTALLNILSLILVLLVFIVPGIFLFKSVNQSKSLVELVTIEFSYLKWIAKVLIVRNFL